MPSHRLIYHFTHINNLLSITQQGLVADAHLGNCSYENSGNIDIKQRRKSKAVPFGGMVADYVPFYFSPRSPMMYTQHAHGRIQNNQIIYLIAEASCIAGKYQWCFSDMNAAKSLASFYCTTEELHENIDWEVMDSTMWNNTDQYPDRMEKRMAEFLVYGRVNWDDFAEIAVYNEVSCRQVAEILGSPLTKPVTVQQNWYF